MTYWFELGEPGELDEPDLGGENGELGLPLTPLPPLQVRYDRSVLDDVDIHGNAYVTATTQEVIGVIGPHRGMKVIALQDHTRR